jgi:hypothetical protein
MVDLSGLAQELQTKLQTAEANLLDAEKRFTLRGASALRRSLRIRAEAADAAANASRDRVLLLEQMATMQAGLEAAEEEREQMRAIARAAVVRAEEAEARADAAEAVLAELHGRHLFSPSLASAASPYPASGASLSPVAASPFAAFEHSMFPAGETRYAVVKHGLPWRGKYARVLVVSPCGVCTLDPASGALTNQWGWDKLLDVSPVGGQPTMIRLTVCNTNSRDSWGVSGRFDSLRASLDGPCPIMPSHADKATARDAAADAGGYLGAPQQQQQTAMQPPHGACIATHSPTPYAARTTAPFTAPAATRAPTAHGCSGHNSGGGEAANVPFWRRLMPTSEMLLESESATAQAALLRQLRFGLASVAADGASTMRA